MEGYLFLRGQLFFETLMSDDAGYTYQNAATFIFVTLVIILISVLTPMITDIRDNLLLRQVKLIKLHELINEVIIMKMR